MDLVVGQYQRDRHDLGENGGPLDVLHLAQVICLARQLSGDGLGHLGVQVLHQKAAGLQAKRIIHPRIVAPEDHLHLSTKLRDGWYMLAILLAGDV